MVKLSVFENDDQNKAEDSGVITIGEIQARMLTQLENDDTGAVDAVATAVTHATHHRASDLHFEPWDDCLSLRYRIDGVLHDIARIPKMHQDRIIARIKILAKMITYKKDTPQEGRIDGDAIGMAHAMRVSTVPTVYGEKTVIRILDASEDLLDLDDLGFRSGVVDEIRDILFRPQGTILLTGPSSSGKTTTIYAILRELMTLREANAHIVTIEDPVEYQLGHIAQTQVNPYSGFTFESALRSILRQDPEVIMLGEIRDPETAKTAIQAGLTGHLVISTIHSGTAAGVFARLFEMGVEPFLIASSVTCVLAQRLARMNCPECKMIYEPDPLLLRSLEKDGKVLADLFSDATPSFFKGKGCEVCQGIGYKGRTAIGELLRVDEELAELILQRPRTRVIHDYATENGMLTLFDEGALRVISGETTIEELRAIMPIQSFGKRR